MKTPGESGFGIAAAQSSSVKGSIVDNVQRHIEFVSVAEKEGADLVVFPELSLTGYEPTIASATAIGADDEKLEPLQETSDALNVAIIAGCPIVSSESRPYLGAFVIRPRLPIEVYRKRYLHGDEVMHFIASDDIIVVPCAGKSVGVAICADINHFQHAADVADQNADIYAAGVAITPNGIAEAEANMSQIARKYRVLAALANYATNTGGYPIAGRSAVWDESGGVIASAKESGECLVTAQLRSNHWEGKTVKV